MRHPLHRPDRCCLACHVIAMNEAGDILMFGHHQTRFVVDRLAGKRRSISAIGTWRGETVG